MRGFATVVGKPLFVDKYMVYTKKTSYNYLRTRRANYSQNKVENLALV
jgi:hypothetical protein